MLNVRMDDELNKKLKRYSQQKNESKSNIVKEALTAYFKNEEMNSTPYELGKDLFGLASSNDPDNSSSYKSKLKQKLNEKHSR